MKYFLYSLLIIVVLVIGFLVLRNKGNNQNLAALVGDAEKQEKESARGVNLSDGEYFFQKGDRIMWSGRKPLKTDYSDLGTVAIRSGAFTVQEGRVSDGLIVLDMNSLRVDVTGSGRGQDGLANHLQSADFFAVSDFPTIKFQVLESFEIMIDGVVSVNGELTVKDTVRELSLPLTIYQQGEETRIKSQFSWDRTQWEVKYGSGNFFDNLADNVIDDQVVISFDVAVIKK
ncbi:TPA: hypothetical protein DCZ15_00140 [Candidatus Falkowbacteria bacterium]|nr:hypothetical protein [Candidatus Falkowbacteria bacterium]